jgi:hypothetical protein
MQEKAPEWVTPDEAQKIIAYLQALKPVEKAAP